MLTVLATTTAAVAMTAAMHQQVSDGTRKKQQIRQNAKKMGAVFGPQVEAGDREEDAETECRG
jgi:hypothetical protein